MEGKWQWSMWHNKQRHFLLCFWGAACMPSVSAGGRVRSPSGTERTGSESRQLDPPQARMPSSENRSIRGRERSKGWQMSDGKRLLLMHFGIKCFVWKMKKITKVGCPPELQNPINYTATSHSSFLTQLGTHHINWACVRIPEWCVYLCVHWVPLSSLAGGAEHMIRVMGLLLLLSDNRKPICSAAALFHIHKFEC